MITGTIIGTVIIIAITIAIGVVADRKLGLIPRADDQPPPRKRTPTHAAGEAPATAIRAGGTQLERLRSSQRCKACRRPIAATGETRVRYDHRELLVFEFRCAACDAKRSLYVEPVGDPVRPIA